MGIFEGSLLEGSSGGDIWGAPLSLYYNSDKAEKSEKETLQELFLFDYDTPVSGSASNSSKSNVCGPPSVSTDADVSPHASDQRAVSVSQPFHQQPTPLVPAFSNPNGGGVVVSNGVDLSKVGPLLPPPQQLPSQTVFQTAPPKVQRPVLGKRVKGLVKRWNVDKGYGFLQPLEGGEDVFVHHSVIHANGFRSLLEGSEVEYEAVEVAPGKVRAEKVTGPESSFVQGAAGGRQTVAVAGAGAGVRAEDVVPMQVPLTPGQVVSPGSIVQVQLPNSREVVYTQQQQQQQQQFQAPVVQVPVQRQTPQAGQPQYVQGSDGQIYVVSHMVWGDIENNGVFCF